MVTLANPLTAYVGGMGQADTARQLGNRRKLDNALATNGTGAMRGDPGAMNALLGAGMVGMEAIGQLRPIGQTDERIEIARQQFRLNRENARAAAAQALQQGINEQNAAAAAAELEDVKRQAATISGLVGGGEETWNTAGREMLGDMWVPFNQAPALIGSMTGEIDAVEQAIEAVRGPERDLRDFNGALVDFNNPEAGPVEVPGMPAQASNDATDRKIARLQTITNPNTGEPFTRQEATEITELVDVVRDPDTDTFVPINRATGQPWQGVGPRQGAAPQPAQPAPQPAQGADPSLSFGERFQEPDAAFGAQGFGARLANNAADIAGVGAPFPGVMETQADVGIWRESVLQSMASAYGGRPPVWLLQRLDAIIPQSGRVTIGPERAQSELRALARQMEAEISTLNMQASSNTVSSAERQIAREKLAANRQALSGVSELLNSFDADDGGGDGMDFSGMGMDDLLAVDRSTLSLEQLRARNDRMEELMGAGQ